MLVTIVAMWAIVIPIAVLAISWQAARCRDARAAVTATRPATRHTAQPGATPSCARRAIRPRRTTTRRVCPELARGAHRRPASA
ncbi:MAG TPA: hypothetical protein VMF14_14170 [Solirubrobacteraceae bacterium]|nr:hypothetical protein [Solirubrobacteraceae bacterium]